MAIIINKQLIMKQKSFLLSFLTAAFLSNAFLLSHAQYWPQWRGPDRDGKVSGFNAPADWPDELKMIWNIKVGLSDATPAVVGNRIYVLSRQGDVEVMQCINPGNGQVIWQTDYPAHAVTGAPSSRPGPRSSPLVAGGKIITLSVGGVVSCFDAADGRLIWRNAEYSSVGIGLLQR